MQAHYILIPLIAVGVVMAGSLITRSGLAWYRTLRIPAWTPPSRIIAGMWTILALLTCASAILAWDTTPPAALGQLAALYLVNAFLNVAFSYLFFVRHQIGSATIEALLLAISVGIMMVQVAPGSWVAALLLVPYLLWVLFAAWLSFTVFRLNA
ncbi:MAG TPA: TspO/MBR family protein [Bryobacteraceae bacterium]|nr:TspO/MBR family protein [Bryobacteraceae bacterium]